MEFILFVITSAWNKSKVIKKNNKGIFMQYFEKKTPHKIRFESA